MTDMDHDTLPPDAETRNHPRVRGTAGVELLSAEGRQACRALDLSLAGCYVETRALPESARVELSFQVPGQRERITCPAEVIRRDRHRDGTVGLALRFLNIDWAALLGLARIVSPQLG